MPRSKWLILTAFSLFLTLFAAACQSQALPASSLAPAAPLAPDGPVLTDLESIEQLEAAFNKDAGRPRLLMILAPL